METGENPLEEERYRGILVFRYLHRPLVPYLKRAVCKGGILIDETFTTEQPKYGKPHNPDYLLPPGELAAWFKGWQTIHHFEGLLEEPPEGHGPDRVPQTGLTLNRSRSTSQR